MTTEKIGCGGVNGRPPGNPPAPQYIITLNNNISVLATQLTHRYTRLQYKNIKNKDCFVLRCYVLTVQTVKGTASHSFPSLPTTKAISCGRQCGEYNYDVAIKDRPLGQALLNEQACQKQLKEYKHLQAVQRQEDRQREQTADKLRWADW